MSFLDEVPLKWTHPEVQELRDLFVIAYRRPAEAEQLADSAGLVPGMFPLHDNMRLIWTALLAEMANQGKLRNLVTLASNDATKSAFQQRFAEMLTNNPPVKRPDPARPANWWKGDDQNPFVAKTLYFERLLERRNRLLHVDVARRLAQVANSVAKLEMRTAAGGRAHGTGFLIQPDLLLTNHHNFFEKDLRIVQSVTADFDDERGIPAEQHLVVKGKVETIAGEAANDWAIIQLENAVDREPFKLGSPYDVGLDDALIIIQHPLGGQKQFALDGMAVRYVDDKIIQYVADTQKGSSGSPVFNSQMHIVGLHHAEAEVTVDVDGEQQIVWRNEGIQIKSVMQSLQQANIIYTPL